MAREMSEQEVYDEVMASFGVELARLLKTPGWSDLMINGDGSVWIDRSVMEKVDCHYSDNGIVSAAGYFFLRGADIGYRLVAGDVHDRKIK